MIDGNGFKPYTVIRRSGQPQDIVFKHRRKNTPGAFLLPRGDKRCEGHMRESRGVVKIPVPIEMQESEGYLRPTER